MNRIAPLVPTLFAALLAGCQTSGPGGLAAASSAAEAPPAIQASLLIEDVTVIDPETRAVRAHQDVVIVGSRIAAVVPHASQAVNATERVDGRGRYLMPGLFDMHSHSSFTPVHRSSLKLMRANGVTGVREMGSDCKSGDNAMTMCIDAMKTSRAAIDRGELVGPRLVQLSSSKLSSNRPGDAEESVRAYTPTNRDEAAASVAFLQARGVEFIKISEEMTPDAVRGLLEAAGAAAIPVGGHVPMMFSVGELARMGLRSVEHARDLPLDCSAHGSVFRTAVADALRGEGPWPDRRAIPAKARDTFDETVCRQQVAAMAAAGTYYVPTHLTREFDVRAGEAAYVDDPRRAYLPRMQLDHWQGDIDRTASAPADFRADLADFFELGLRTTRIAHEAGVAVMVGTDANDTMVFPGFSVHDEMRHLAAAGLSEMDVLRAATTVPAAYLGRSDDFGGVSEGKLADLLLLTANPLEDIDHSDAIAAVIFDGRLDDRATLDRYLAEVREWVAMADAQAARVDTD